MILKDNWVKGTQTTGSDHIFLVLCPEPSETLAMTFPDALDHHHKVTPFHLVAVALPIVFGQLHPKVLSWMLAAQIKPISASFRVFSPIIFHLFHVFLAVLDIDTAR